MVFFVLYNPDIPFVSWSSAKTGSCHFPNSVLLFPSAQSYRLKLPWVLGFLLCCCVRYSIQTQSQSPFLFLSANCPAEALAAVADVKLLCLGEKQRTRETTRPWQRTRADSACCCCCTSTSPALRCPPPAPSPWSSLRFPRWACGSSPHRCSPHFQPFRMTRPHTPDGTTHHSHRRTAPSPPGNTQAGNLRGKKSLFKRFVKCNYKRGSDGQSK